LQILLAYLFYFVAATASPLQRRLQAKKTQSNVLLLATQTQIVVCCLGLLLLIKPGQGLGLTVSALPISFGIILFGGLFHSLSYLSQKHVDAAQTSVISNIYTPVTILLAVLFLNDQFTTKQFFGTLILIVAVLLIAVDNITRRTLRISRYSFMMLASGSSLGVILFLEKLMMNMLGAGRGVFISWVLQLIGLAIVSKVFSKNLIGNKPKFREIALSSILRFAQQVSYVILLVVVGNLAVVSAVTTFKIVFVFAASYILLDERTHIKRKVVGSLLALIGLLLTK
jgi:drug/metabolite transporter (DMT)-like permease